ncbi:MAG: ankyrin repeat domain-containing protein [Treponema sp.]|jgi:ankyrin repeat protein|nr:ankyrin repeat domain-containing protein [Treponema sp.]
MKKANFIFAPTGVIFGIILFLASCNTPPPPAEPQEEPDIWTLLSSGDSRARNFFMGEVGIGAVDQNGKTPLHYAAEKGDTQLAAFFISLGAKPDVLDNSKQSPLGIAVGKNDAKMAELLVKENASIHLQIKEDSTAAKNALSMNSAIFKSILTSATVESADNDGKTVLHLASIEGNVTGVRNILELLASSSVIVNKQDNEKTTALDYALKRPDSVNHMEIAELLILNGGISADPVYAYLMPAVRSANFNIRRSEGLAPIHYAVSDSHIGLITFLFNKNIDVNIKSMSGSTALHEAARTGNIQIMTMLLDKGANVNSADGKGNTPLHVGIPAGVHRQALSLMLERGADPNLRDEHGDTPLHIVIILNRPLDVIQTLLGGGSDVHIRNMNGKTPLYIAVEEKRTEVIPLLLSYNSEIFAADNSGVTPFYISLKDTNLSVANVFSTIVTPETVYQRDSAGNTMLHVAVRNRATAQQIGLILDNKALVDARNREGDISLHLAVRMNQREIGEFLISRGASIFTANAAGISPLYLALTSTAGIREWIINPTTIIAADGLGNNMLHYAAQWNLINAIPVIIRHGIKVDITNATGETPLFMAVRTDSPATIRTLLENRANLNIRDKQGNSLLHTAVRWNSKDSAQMLITSGIDINAHSLNGNTALHDSVILGMTDIEVMLIKEKANLEVRDFDGNTPFMEAVKAGLIPSIERLAANGADPSTRNNSGDTALHTAVAAQRYDLVAILLRMGASIHARNTRNMTPFKLSFGISPRMVTSLLTRERINVPDDMGNTALHLALQERAPIDVIRAIINQGARINAVDNNGQTPLRIAVDMEQYDIVKLLADLGSDPFLTAVDNKSPADIAFVKGNDCIRALFSGRAINAKDSSANTILHLAARFGTPAVITTLLELGANRTLTNVVSETPRDIAVRWDRKENADLLK